MLFVKALFRKAMLNPFMRLNSLILCVGLLILPTQLAAQSSVLFPRPAGIEPAINFWVKVYTEVDTRNGFLHDSQNLNIIYQRLPQNRRQIDSTRGRIQADLRILASGDRNRLNQNQRDILALWPADVSGQTLLRAASNVRWQLGQSDRFLGGLQRSGAYRDHIRNVINEKNLPIELAVLPHVESSFNPGAYSSASAAGMWQFGRATGMRFMRIDHIVDERMDPYTATNAAMSLLEYNYSVLGTWPLALTAYNHGAAGIARAVAEMGTTDIGIIVADYHGSRFGFASRNFYAQFLAVLQVEQEAEHHFSNVRFNPAPNFREVEIDAYIDAEVFARSVGISLEQLRADNPALRPAVWDGNKRIPKSFAVKVRAEAVADGDLLAMIPNDFKFGLQTPDVAYVVVKGDSLSVIARRFRTSISSLVSLNQLTSRNRISIGQRLLLPQDNASSAAAIASSTEAAQGLYTVRRGDTVSRIAARYGVTERALLGVNGLSDPHRIYPGQQISLPGFEDLQQFAAIDANGVPTPPVQIQFSDELEVATREPAATQSAPAQPQVREVIESAAELDSGDLRADSIQLALNETLDESLSDSLTDTTLTDTSLTEISIPPAAVLPDNQELESPVTAAEEQAIALDPAVNVAQSNEQLTEALSADPSDYLVASNNSVEIQASETLGHYADWLGILSWDLRRLNNMAFRDPVIIGKRLKLDFSRVNIAEFELKRRNFHSILQQEFFANYRIQGVELYQIKRGDNIGSIARNKYSTPIWLLRQYNPELEFSRIQIDQEIMLPLLQQVN